MPTKVKSAKLRIEKPKNLRGRLLPQTQLVLAPASEIPVTLDRSFELVRTVITAAISNITWIRDVFPDECYEVLNYDSSDPDCSYDAFMKGASPLTKKPGNFSWRVLARGTDGGVDKFLNWMENGVKIALEKKYLASLQLSFYEGKKVSADMLVEAYTLSIIYTDKDASVQLSTSGKNSNQKEIMLLDAKEGIRRLINSNIVTAQDMDGMVPSLPDQRVADMQLTYTVACPKGWNAPGFKSCLDPNLIIVHEESLGRRTESLNTGHHGIRITLFNKSLTSRKYINSSSSDVESVMKAVEKGLCSQPAIPKQPSRRRAISQSSEIDYQPTQESVVEAFKSIGVSRDPHGATQDTQPLQHIHQCQSTAATSQYITGGCPYTQPVREMIKVALFAKQAAYSTIDHGIDEILEPGPHVACECGASTDEGNIIQCNVCDRFQHIHCYGYLETAPPSEFICYTCLLVRSEKTLLSQMRCLCVKRRALCFLLEKGSLEDVGDLAGHLNRDEATTTNILDQLKSVGLVLETKNPKGGRRGKDKAGTPVFTFVNNALKLQHDFFHPRLNIEHHFKIPDDSASGETVAPDSLESQTPQAATSNESESVPVPNMLPLVQTRGVRDALSSSRPVHLDGSSTQGTPSPKVPTRDIYAPQPETPAASAQRDEYEGIHTTKGLVPPGNKRGFLPDPGQPGFVKRVRASTANSPWSFSRK